METGFKVFRRGVLDRIRLKEDRFGFEPEVTAKLARLRPRPRIFEVGVSYYGRTYAEGKKIGLRDAFKAFQCILRYSIWSRKLVAFMAVCICLAVSAMYELIEWWSALAMGQGADEFLGTQGDPWDTQSDMFFALIGALCALALLSRLHDREMHRLHTARSPVAATSA